MVEESPRLWRGQSSVARAAERRAQLVTAAVDLLGREGARGLTMRAACRQAELSPRYFYESFADRDALLLAAFDDTLERMRVAVLAAFARGGDDRLRAGVDAAARLVQSDARVGRILFREPFADDVLRAHAVARIPGFFLDAFAQLPGGSAALGRRRTAQQQLRISALSGALISLFLDWTEGRFGRNRRAFADYCTQVAVTLLA